MVIVIHAIISVIDAGDRQIFSVLTVSNKAFSMMGTVMKNAPNKPILRMDNVSFAPLDVPHVQTKHVLNAMKGFLFMMEYVKITAQRVLIMMKVYSHVRDVVLLIVSFVQVLVVQNVKSLSIVMIENV